MLAIKQKSPSPSAVTANLLPCRIHHDGSITLSDRHWAPSQPTTTTPPASSDTKSVEKEEESSISNSNESSKLIAHFRGRRLLGREVSVPEGYTGALIRTSKEEMPKAPRAADEDDEDGEDERTFVAEQEASFEKIVLWRHEEEAEGLDDRYIRSVEEWIGFAETVSRNF
jgi:ribonuclease H2 subunit C